MAEMRNLAHALQQPVATALLRQYLAARAAETKKDERLDRLIQQHLGIRSVA